MKTRLDQAREASETTIRALESSLHTHLAEIGVQISDARVALANNDWADAARLLQNLEHDLLGQLHALDYDETAATGTGSTTRAGHQLDHDPLCLDIEPMEDTG